MSLEDNLYEKLIEEAKNAGINWYVAGGAVYDDSSVLLLKRPKDDFMGGIYELPSGKVETEESLREALHREIYEETGLTVKTIDRYLGYFDYLSKKREKTRQFNFAVTVETPLNIILAEHEDYIWAEESQLRQYPVTDSVKEVLGRFWKD